MRSLSTRQIHRRLEKLSARIRPNQNRSFTLEELCWEYWRLDRSGFRALVSRFPEFSVFLSIFEREDAERQGSRALNRRQA